jgi:hypothetical protein
MIGAAIETVHPKTRARLSSDAEAREHWPRAAELVARDAGFGKRRRRALEPRRARGWRTSEATEARRIALYLVVVGACVPRHAVGRLVGMTGAGVCAALHAIEQRRDDEPDFDARLEALEAAFTGETDGREWAA